MIKGKCNSYSSASMYLSFRNVSSPNIADYTCQHMFDIGMFEGGNYNKKDDEYKHFKVTYESENKCEDPRHKRGGHAPFRLEFTIQCQN